MKYLIYIISVFLLVGCGGNSPKLPNIEAKTNNTEVEKTIEAKTQVSNIATQMTKESINVRNIYQDDSNNEKVILVDTSKYIFFSTGKYTVRNLSKLKKFIKKFKDNNHVYFYIVGHTDSVGADKNNQLLSEMRAREVYKTFISLGFEISKLDYIGYGEEQPIATNKTKYGRAKNRRVELIVSSRPNLSQRFLQTRVINTQYLNNHNNINSGKVQISTKGLTKNKSDKELRLLQSEIRTQKRKSFNVNIEKRSHYIN